MKNSALVLVITVIIVLLAFIIPMLITNVDSYKGASGYTKHYKGNSPYYHGPSSWSGWNHLPYKKYYWLHKQYWYPDYYFYRGYYPMYYPRYTKVWRPWMQRPRYNW